MLGIVKKISKVMPEDEVKSFDGEINTLLRKSEQSAKADCDAKENELK